MRCIRIQRDSIHPCEIWITAKGTLGLPVDGFRLMPKTWELMRDLDRLNNAYEKAAYARFEHEEASS